MSVISSSQIRDRIFSREAKEERLVVTPMLDPNDQIQEGSLDLRLGTEFLVFERGLMGTVDPLDEVPDASREQTERRVKRGLMEKFWVHPRQFVLGSSLEYLGLPDDLIGYVVGRSSWGRLGLLIATAIGIHAGYRGVVTLELTNLGEVPIAVYPGWPIAQIFFHERSESSTDPDKTPYYLSVRPEGSRLISTSGSQSTC